MITARDLAVCFALFGVSACTIISTAANAAALFCMESSPAALAIVLEVATIIPCAVGAMNRNARLLCPPRNAFVYALAAVLMVVQAISVACFTAYSGHPCVDILAYVMFSAYIITDLLVSALIVELAFFATPTARAADGNR